MSVQPEQYKSHNLCHLARVYQPIHSCPREYMPYRAVHVSEILSPLRSSCAFALYFSMFTSHQWPSA